MPCRTAGDADRTGHRSHRCRGDRSPRRACWSWWRASPSTWSSPAWPRSSPRSPSSPSSTPSGSRSPWCCRWRTSPAPSRSQRIALRTKAWFSVATSQLAGNAISLIVPGGAAFGAATQFRMLAAVGQRLGDGGRRTDGVLVARHRRAARAADLRAARHPGRHPDRQRPRACGAPRRRGLRPLRRLRGAWCCSQTDPSVGRDEWCSRRATGCCASERR